MKNLWLSLVLCITSSAFAATPCGVGSVKIASGFSSVTYVDTTVVQGTTYDYGVTVTDANGVESACSNRVTPFVPNIAPPPPHQVTLTWVASTTVGLLTYNVYRITPPNPATKLTQVTQ